MPNLLRFLIIFWSAFELNGEPIQVEIAIYASAYPDSLATMPYCGPWVDIAVEEVNRQYAGRFQFKRTYLYDRRFRCDTIGDNAAHLVSRWYYRERLASTVPAVMFLGCGQEAAALNSLSANLNVPLCSGTGDDVIRQKTLSPTFISYAHFSKTAFTEFVTTMATLYAWSSVFVVLDQTSVPLYTSLSRQVIAGFSKLRDSQIRSRVFNDNHFSTARKILQEFRHMSRVLFFFGRAEHLRTFLIEAHNLNMTDGEFAYVVMENFLYKPLYGLLHWKENDEYDEIVRQAYGSLLIIRPVDFNDIIRISNSSSVTPDDIAERARRDYNVSLPGANQPLVNSGYSYAPIVVLAQTLNVSYERYGAASLFDGRHLTGLMLNKTFSTIMGPISIDPVGERRVDLSLWQYIEDSDEFLPFLRKNALSGEIHRLRNVTFVQGKPWPPPNTPQCGYTGLAQRCRTRTDLLLLLPVLFCSLMLLILTAIGTGRDTKKTEKKKDKFQFRSVRYIAGAAKGRWWLLPAHFLRVPLIHPPDASGSLVLNPSKSNTGA